MSAVHSAVTIDNEISGKIINSIRPLESSRQFMKSFMVSLLSLYDLLFLLAVLLLAILHLCDVTDPTATGLLNSLRQLGLWGATYTMVDISIERCLSIDRPFLARKICGVGFTLKRAAVILVAGVLVTVPFVLDLIFNLSTTRECSEKRTLTTFGVVYTLYISILFFYIIPFICIFVANARLIFALLQVGKHSQEMSTNCSSQTDSSVKQLSLFVVGLCVWYGVCMVSPSILFLVRLSRVELFSAEKDLVAAVIADSLIVSSAAANFVFYFLMWRNFRHTFLRMFCHRCLNGCLHLDSNGGSGHTSNSDHINLHHSAHGTSESENVGVE